MKILVRGTNWIGDAMMSVPALRELRRIFPDAHIALHTRSWAEGLFGSASFIDELVTYDKHRWVVKDVLDNSRFLRDDAYDLAIILPNSFESALTSVLSRIPRRIGFNKDVRGLLLTDPIAVPEWKNRRHEVYYYLHLIAEVERRVLGTGSVLQNVPDTSIEIDDDVRGQALDRLRSAGVDLGRPIVVLGPGSANSRAKRWPAERYAALARRLTSERNANVVLLGSKDERDVSSQVASLTPTPLIDLTGETSLAEAVAILAIADLLISNDMGLAHVAPAVATPVISIFGPTDPATTRPFSNDAYVIRHPVECSPCMLRDCPIDHRCMTRIEVDNVFEVARGLLTGEQEATDDTAEALAHDD